MNRTSYEPHTLDDHCATAARKGKDVVANEAGVVGYVGRRRDRPIDFTCSDFEPAREDASP